MNLPTDAQARKNVPLFSGLLAYFPDALIAVASLSKIGNDQHNPGKPLAWDRSKSEDELDALTRHLFEAGTEDIDGVLHSTKVAWRALANLQKELEVIKGLPISRGSSPSCSTTDAQERLNTLRATLPTSGLAVPVGDQMTAEDEKQYIDKLNKGWDGHY